MAAGARWWPLQMARELDDAILSLRTNELELGLWIVRTSGSPAHVLAVDDFLLEHQDNWFVREVLGMMRRTLRAPRRVLTVDFRNCRAGIVLRRHADGAGARGGSRLYARFRK